MVPSLVFYIELLLRYKVFFLIYTRILLSRVMGCHGNHEISYNQNAFIFEDNIFWHLSGPIEQFYTHNKMSYGFNLGLIAPLNTSFPNCLSLIFKFSLIFMNMKMRSISYRTTG